MLLPPTKTGRIWLVVLIAAVGVLAVLLLPPLRQPQSYHQFADQRTMLGMPNFMNVASNGAFLVVGWMGLAFLMQKRLMQKRAAGASGSFIEASERLPYAVFFLGAVLTCFGSAYYH
jgi:ABC-type transport system involved in cytochrome c biogenesis permease subunit